VNAKQTISFFAIVAISFTAFAADLSSPAEPIYKGQLLSAWLEQLPLYREGEDNLASQEYATNEAVIAIRKIGTNALPCLLSWLQATNDTKSRDAIIGFAFLGDIAKPAIPQLSLVLLNHPNQAYSDSEVAAMILSKLGKDGICALINALASSNTDVRVDAAFSFCLDGDDSKSPNKEARLRFRREASVAVPELTVLLRDQNWKVGAAAAYALGSLHQKPEIAVPALFQITNDVSIDKGVRRVAAHSLTEFDAGKNGSH
jgi:HEAT repeat protein